MVHMSPLNHPMVSCNFLSYTSIINVFCSVALVLCVYLCCVYVYVCVCVCVCVCVGVGVGKAHFIWNNYQCYNVTLYLCYIATRYKWHNYTSL